jgi:hypothetical protein
VFLSADKACAGFLHSTEQAHPKITCATLNRDAVFRSSLIAKNRLKILCLQSGEDGLSKFKFLYVISPLFSVALAMKGYPATYVALGVACSLGFVLLDTIMLARRMFDMTGSGRTAGYFLIRMARPVAVMIIPAIIWNVVGFGVGWVISQLIA